MSGAVIRRRKISVSWAVPSSTTQAKQQGRKRRRKGFERGLLAARMHGACWWCAGALSSLGARPLLERDACAHHGLRGRRAAGENRRHPRERDERDHGVARAVRAGRARDVRRLAERGGQKRRGRLVVGSGGAVHLFAARSTSERCAHKLDSGKLRMSKRNWIKRALQALSDLSFLLR